MPNQEPEPSNRARAVVRTGYDTHIHVAPDVMERRIDDLSLARRFRDVGLAGFVLKSHYVPTAERAAVVRAAEPGVDALGAITLNNSVGGMNPAAVEIAGRGGARVVWLPTVDAGNQRSSRSLDPEGAKPPMWAQMQDDLRADGMLAPPVAVLTGDGEVSEQTRAVLRVIGRHDMVLATGHLSADEISLVVPAAFEEGVRRVVVTHPEFTSQRLTVEQQMALADAGALLERCYTTPHTGKVTWDLLVENILAVGVQHSVVSSDLGQPFNPPVEDGLALMADQLFAAGVSDDDVHTMTVTNTRALSAPAAAVLAGGAV